MLITQLSPPKRLQTLNTLYEKNSIKPNLPNQHQNTVFRKLYLIIPSGIVIKSSFKGVRPNINIKRGAALGCSIKNIW